MATEAAEPSPVINGVTASASPLPDNGDLANSSAKRKREDSTSQLAAVHTNGTTSTPNGEEHSPTLSESLHDILKVLRRHDTSPSVLLTPLSKDSEEKTFDEPSAKRAKLNGSPTVTSRIESGDYTSFSELVEDVDAVIEELLTTIKSKEIDLPQTQYGRPSTLTAAETRLWTGTTKFQALLSELVHAEKERQNLVKGGKVALKKAKAEDDASAGAPIKKEEDEESTHDDSKPVLTLYANALAPKQLFSSLQKAENDGTIPPLRESGLPSFISTTNITPIPAEKKSKDGPTIGEVFGHKSEKYQLQPPKPVKTKLVTTGNTVEFVRVDGPVRPNRRNSTYNYFADKLAVGQWLGYGGVDMPIEPTSPQAKRKQRDRALSSGEAFLPPSDSEKEALRKARNDALFRKCYGSFAPSYDDSVAVVPKDVRNEIWMDKVTERITQKSLVIDPALIDPSLESAAAEGEKWDMTELQQFVDDFDPAILKWDEKQRKQEKEMEDLLQEISELLETLASFQRIRNSSIKTPSTLGAAKDTSTDLIGTPTEPSTAEKDVYKTLKLQLAMLVDQLPPHAVARLNGDQLKELNIKTSIIIATEDGRGVMAEDEATRSAKMQAYAAAAGSQAQVGRTPSTNSYANYSGGSASQYNRTPAQQAPLRPSTNNYYTPGNQNRPPAPITYNRSSSGLQNSYSSNYSQSTNRPSYQSYNSSTSRPNQFQGQSSQYYGQMTANANKSSYNQNYQHSATPQQQRPGYQPGTPASTYQSRPANNGPAYSGYNPTQSPQGRTNSPQVPAQNQYGQRPGYSTPGSGANYSQYRPPTSTASQQQYSSQYQQNRPAQNASMTPSRQGSGTPQPAQSYGQANGTTPTPNMLSQQSS